MKCPFCGHSEDKVLDTRVQKDDGIRRRRECLSCKSRYSTLETVIVSYPFVIKKDGRREPFNKEKLLRGLSYACNKRPVATASLDAIVERIASWVITRGEGEISARVIGRRVMNELKKLDDVAYVRFASVYKTFKDVQDFVEKLEGDELIDMIDSSGPQLSLTTQLQQTFKMDSNSTVTKLETKKETTDEKTIKGTRSPDPIPN